MPAIARTLGILTRAAKLAEVVLGTPICHLAAYVCLRYVRCLAGVSAEVNSKVTHVCETILKQSAAHQHGIVHSPCACQSPQHRGANLRCGAQETGG